MAFDEHRNPKRYGFVAFSTPEEAQEAVKRFSGYEMTVQMTNPWSKRTIIVQPSVSSYIMINRAIIVIFKSVYLLVFIFYF